MSAIVNYMSAFLSDVTPTEKKKTKEKVTVDSSEEKVADALTGFLETKGKELKTKLDSKQQELEKADKQIKELIRKARTLRTTTGALAQKYESVVNKNRSEVVDDYRKIITKIKLLDFIDKFEVDSKKRILFTTTPIAIKKDKWLKSKVAGRYQVRIDFGKGDIREGIRAINLDKVYGEYDHPNIRDSYFCYGTRLAIDVEQEYREQDLYELVIDLVDLLRSPNDQDGFTRWRYFFTGAKKRPKNYSFVKYDQREIDNAFPAFQVNEASTGWNHITATGWSIGPAVYYPESRSSVEHNERYSITVHLLRLGFVDQRTAEYYTDRILQRTRGIIPNLIELRRLPSLTGLHDAELYFRYPREREQLVSASAVTTATYTSPGFPLDTIDRIIVPENLLRPEGSRPPDPEELRRMSQEREEDMRRLEEERLGARQQLMQEQYRMATINPQILIDELEKNEDSNSS